MSRNTNRYIINGETADLILRNGHRTIVPTDKVEELKRYTWCREGTGYFMSRSYGKAVKLHRIIMKFENLYGFHPLDGL